MSIKISVCMIIKNESKILDRCLKNTKKFADEIIIVDTGSTDNSKEIAKSYTNNVYDYVWQNDFSKARNYSFSFAKYDYIMWLDADDIITSENIKKINKLKNEEQHYDNYAFKYVNKINDNSNFWYYRERLVKRTNYPKWQGFIHETISYNGDIKYLDIEIEHKPKKNKNPQRNLKIYNYHLNKGTRLNTREQYYYAKELFYNNFYYSATKALKKYLKMPYKFEANIIDAYATLAKIYEIKQDYHRALDYLFSAIKYCTPTSEILCAMGDLYIKLNQYKKSIFFYENALTCKINNVSCNFVDSLYYYLYPLLQLTYLYFKIGDISSSKYYHNLCMKNYSQDKRVQFNEEYFKSIIQ